MTDLRKVLRRYGADDEAIHLFQDDGPHLLPYATLLAARGARASDLSFVHAVYEWQSSPLMFLVDDEGGVDDPDRLHRIRRLLAMRGDAPYLGVVSPGRLDIYAISLDDRSLADVRVDLGLSKEEEVVTFSRLSNERPGLAKAHGEWILQVVLKLLTSSIDRLKEECQVDDEDAISLVGRALFTRFLGDRDLLGAMGTKPSEVARLFDNRTSAQKTSRWLDKTFNGDFLPTSAKIFGRLPPQAFKILGDILHRAPGGQLFLGWQERWDNLDFAHIPVGVLSQAYECYLRRHAPEQQRREGGYYTPRVIAELMVRGTFHALKRSGKIENAKVLDPAAGAGVFLLTAFRQLAENRWRRDGRRPTTRVLREILYEQICGFDINEAALRFAALGLYLMSIELDPHPEPVRKLRFENLRGVVLHKFGKDADSKNRTLGSLGSEPGAEHIAKYDLVIGNPPWASGTQLPQWTEVQKMVARIAKERLPSEQAAPTLPNEVLDLPFVWRAMEWAKPGGQIAFALHARLLFQQGDGMQVARRALFSALDVTAVVNGVELRQTKVWPEISAPFCILYARNRVPSPGTGFRLVSPRLETTLNSAGALRIDADNAEVVTTDQLKERPEILKILFRGGQADLQVYERIASLGLTTLDEFWGRAFDSDGSQLNFKGNGFQKLRPSSRVRKVGDGLPGVPAAYLHKLPLLTQERAGDLLIDTISLPKFSEARIHDPRPRSLFEAPLLIVHKSPPAHMGRIHVSVADRDVVFNETFYGYSAKHHSEGDSLVRFLTLVLGSKVALWLALITSGEFGFEREVIEKATIDRIPIPDFETLPKPIRRQIGQLFDEAQSGDEAAWHKVDEWLAPLYGLRARDLDVIADTLKFSLPFAANRLGAQVPVRDKEVSHFCKIVGIELQPWGKRFGRSFQVSAIPTYSSSPWRAIRISQETNDGVSELDPKRWAQFLRVADSVAATQVTYVESSNSICIARLAQARYWSKTQARNTAQRIIWDHVELLSGRKRA